MAQVHPHTGTETLVGSPSTDNPKSGLTPKTDPGTPPSGGEWGTDIRRLRLHPPERLTQNPTESDI